MKKLLIIVFIALFSLNSYASELKNGALYCVGSKKIINYYDYLEQGYDDYAQRLLDNSDCFIKNKQEKVYILLEQKKYTQVELPTGFKVWTKKENIIR